MKTTKKLVCLAVPLVALLFLHACDYYEPPELIPEQEINSESSAGTSEIPDLDAEDRITLYQVDGEDIIKIQDYDVEGELLDLQNDVAKHQELWALVKKIIPLEYRSKMSQFLIYHGEKTKTSGFVNPTLNNLSQWQFALAIDYAYKTGFNFEDDLVFTIIHELGHILTLNNEQVTPGIISRNCTNYFVSKGCAKTDSYISTFYTRFWSDIEDEYNALNDSPESKLNFYTKYNDRFISEYAAESPREDIAEIFASFVVNSNIDFGDSVKDQKIQMMYDYPELIELREFIRQSMPPQVL